MNFNPINMKKSIITLAILVLSSVADAQHYGGVSTSFNFMESDNNYSAFKDHNKLIGLGYQGSLFTDKRLNMLYGARYSYTFEPDYGGDESGWKRTMHSAGISLGVRLNILKETKWQPYVFAQAWYDYAFYGKMMEVTNGKVTSSKFWYGGPNSHIPVGAGVSYKHKSLMFNGELYRDLVGYIGIGLSVMKKF